MDKSFQKNIKKILMNNTNNPITIEQIKSALDLDNTAETFKLLVKTLVLMEQKNQIKRTPKNRYYLAKSDQFITGTVSAHSQGYGFVTPNVGGYDDIFIPAIAMNSAMHGDTVTVKLSPASSGAKHEGTITDVVMRANKEIICLFEKKSKEHKFDIAIPDNPKLPNQILIAKSAAHGAISFHKVIVKITEYGGLNLAPQGEIIKIIGHKNDPGVDILSIIYQHKLPLEFSHAARKQSRNISSTISDADLVNRRDLRDELIITIDGSDAKDLDDAVSVTKLSNGNFLLGVHIADVSHYINENSPIDKEAFLRGTSVYLVDRVIPMIPHRLSNDICSLQPNSERLTISCVMEIDDNGTVVSHEIFPSVIKTTARMTYDDVNKILQDGDSSKISEYEKIFPMLKQMETLSRLLNKKRKKRGSIDFEFSEAKVLVDENGTPYDVVIRQRLAAERLIEEFMLCANETVAEHFFWLDVPFIYRIHETPDEDKLKTFFEFILRFGLIIRGAANNVHPQALQKVLDEVCGKPEELVISKILLRSMKQAKYSPVNCGHFGLSAEFYTHFTSPIRRYPDLIVHRLIRRYLFENKIDGTAHEKENASLGEISQHCSAMERRAIAAERDTDELKKVQFMADKLGEKFEGIISSITNFGIFVQLPNTIEGLVHVSQLTDDYYTFDVRTYSLIGDFSRKTFQIGDHVIVQVAAVNTETKTIDFQIIANSKPRKRKEKTSKVLKIMSAQTNKKLREKNTNKKENKEKSTSPKQPRFYENVPKKKRKKGKK